MACTFTMANLLLDGPVDAGGDWSLNSGGTTDWMLGGVLVSSLTAGTSGLGNETLTIAPVPNPGGTATGTYVFRYSVGTGPGTCSATADLTINIVDGAVVGSSVTLNLCSGDPTIYHLGNLLYGGTGLDTDTGNMSTNGTWSGSGVGTGNGTDYGHITNTGVPLDDEFAVSNGVDTIANGAWTFKYEVDNEAADTPSGCDECKKDATVTINITDGADAGTDNTVTLCVDVPLV